MSEQLNRQANEGRASLRFVELERRLTSSEAPVLTARQRRNFSVLLAGTMLGMLLSIVSKFAGWRQEITAAGVLIELGCLFVILYLQARDIVAGMRYTRLDFAGELDQEYDLYRQIGLDASRDPQLDIKLSFLRARLETLMRRHNFAFGPIEKLGILPMLVALLLQYLAAGVEGAMKVGLVGGLLAIFIMLVYLLGLWTLGLKNQLERYVRVFELLASMDVPVRCSKPDSVVPSGLKDPPPR